jgi:mannonate dehydratase
MADGDIYETVAKFANADRIGYIHFLNVKGQVPNYRELFLDETDNELARIISNLKEANYEGVLIPDHALELECNAPWHAGKAFAIGYRNALIAQA